MCTDAARLGAELAGRDRHPRLHLHPERLRRRELHQVDARRHHVQLDVGTRELRARLHEHRHVSDRPAQRAAPGERVSHDLPAQPQAVRQLVDRRVLGLHAPLACRSCSGPACSRRPRQSRARPGRRAPAARLPGRSPESSSSCGEATAPAARITSLGRAHRAAFAALDELDADGALASNRMRVVDAPRSRPAGWAGPSPGADRPTAAEWRLPFSAVTWNQVTPSWSPALMSFERGMPASTQASISSRDSGCCSVRVGDVERAAGAVALVLAALLVLALRK